MTNQRPFFLFLFTTFAVLTIAGCLFFVLWKFGVGEWSFVVSVACVIGAVIALLYTVSKLEGPKLADRRIGSLLYIWLVLMGTALMFFALWKAGAGQWAASASMLCMGLFVLCPPIWFIVQPDLAITTFNALTGNINAPDDWSALSPSRRAVVYVGTLLFLAIGILLLVGAFHVSF